MLASPRRPSSTTRIFSSAEKCRRVARRMSWTIRSAGALTGSGFGLIFAPDGYDDPEILRSRIPSICPTGADGGHSPPRPRPGAAPVLAATVAPLGAAALYNGYRTRQVERRHPPAGRFIEVDGIRLHYLERGAGTPVVLIHGNVVTAEDWVLSGVLDRIAERGHRVIAFDRPGYGYSDRPRRTAWTAKAQADLLRHAFARLG